MKNIVLKPLIRKKIDDRVDRILRDLDNPEPPLRLEEVRELLRLDLSYYQGDNDGFLRETIHRLVVAGKQVLARPALIVDTFNKFSLRALYTPDRKRILIDDRIPKSKHRWLEGHEIIHDVLEWHEPVSYGDNEITVKQSCRDKIEAEANYGAGQLLFLRQRFVDQAVDSPPSVDLVRALAKSFGNTNASTLWRLVETTGRTRPMLGVIHFHPHPRFKSDKFDPANPCRHFIQSDAFATQFSNLGQLEIFEILRSYCAPRVGGPLGKNIAVLTDVNGDEHEFAFESFGFHHECLTLGLYLRKRPIAVAVPAGLVG